MLKASHLAQVQRRGTPQLNGTNPLCHSVASKAAVNTASTVGDEHHGQLDGQACIIDESR